MANKLFEALDPRVPIYRDTYNEYFVLILSAGGARTCGSAGARTRARATRTTASSSSPASPGS